jgi:hypothetical protein
MRVNLDLPENAGTAIAVAQLVNYTTFRAAMPKPPGEEAHLRNILRFYVARALSKTACDALLIRPVVCVDDHRVEVDVAAPRGTHVVLAICEPAVVTPATAEKLAILKDVSDVEVVVVHSRFASPGNVQERFKEQFASRMFRLMSVVPPPFDDVLEYDIWMFELTFQEAMT